MTRFRRPVVQWPMVAWLAVVWVAMWGEVSWANVLGGIVVGVLVTIALPLPTIDYRGRVHPIGIVRLIWFFAVDLVVASAQVAWLALNLRRTPRGAVIRVDLRSQSDLYLTLTAELCSLVPGSLIVEAHRLTGTLYVHVLDVDTAGGIEAARAHVLAVEERVLRALASPAELEEAL